MDRTQGIPRCSNCRGYINCFCTFLENNTKFRCNLCGEESDLPLWFRAFLPAGAMNTETTPELQYGSYEAVIDNAQFNMKPSPVSVMGGCDVKVESFVFVIDCSVTCVNSGLLRAAVEAIRAGVGILNEKNTKARVGFVVSDVRSHYLCVRNGRVSEKIDADYEEAFDCVSCEEWLIEVNDTSLPDVTTTPLCHP